MADPKAAIYNNSPLILIFYFVFTYPFEFSPLFILAGFFRFSSEELKALSRARFWKVLSTCLAYDFYYFTF
jgi:hypothetical protein